MKNHSLRVELFLLGFLALLWGSSYLFIKVAVAEIPPITLISLRVFGAALFLMIVMWLRAEGLPGDARIWRMLMVQAFFNSIGAWMVLAWGQQFVGAGLASVLNSTSPIFVVLITAFVTRHEGIGGRKLLGAALGILGVVLIVGVDVLGVLGEQIAGQVACLVGAALYAGAAIYGKRFGHLSAVATATGTMICASVVLVPAALALERPWALSPSLAAMVADRGSRGLSGRPRAGPDRACTAARVFLENGEAAGASAEDGGGRGILFRAAKRAASAERGGKSCGRSRCRTGPVPLPSPALKGRRRGTLRSKASRRLAGYSLENAYACPPTIVRRAQACGVLRCELSDQCCGERCRSTGTQVVIEVIAGRSQPENVDAGGSHTDGERFCGGAVCLGGGSGRGRLRKRRASSSASRSVSRF